MPLLVQAQAAYRVVQPDGSVVYTDRPPSAALARQGALRDPVAGASAAAATSVGPALPGDLRAVAQRQPVVLYTAAACTACDSARRLLQQRGIPFAERLVVGDDDVRALERTVGTRTVPVLTIGTQQLRAFSPDVWTAYLDAAGYPSTSRLPRGWTGPVPRPLTTPASDPAAPAAPDAGPVDAAPPARPLPPPPPPTPGPGRLRF